MYGTLIPVRVVEPAARDTVLYGTLIPMRVVEPAARRLHTVEWERDALLRWVPVVVKQGTSWATQGRFCACHVWERPAMSGSALQCLGAPLCIWRAATFWGACQVWIML